MTSDEPTISDPTFTGFLAPDLVTKIEKAIKKEVGAKSEMVVMDFSTPRSIFIHTSTGPRCNNCGADHTGIADVCSVCGAAYVLQLIIGNK